MPWLDGGVRGTRRGGSETQDVQGRSFGIGVEVDAEGCIRDGKGNGKRCNAGDADDAGDSGIARRIIRGVVGLDGGGECT